MPLLSLNEPNLNASISKSCKTRLPRSLIENFLKTDHKFAREDKLLFTIQIYDSLNVLS